ncbi:MAG: formyltetrahydrofolate deformylase [Myxococcota bacterium]|jgi:formyltetrahydrofolate deformylase
MTERWREVAGWHPVGFGTTIARMSTTKARSSKTVSPTATLLLACPDSQGLVARIAGFVFEYGGNILHADHHHDRPAGLFLSRIEWELTGFRVPRERIASAFTPLAEDIGATFEVHYSDTVTPMAIFATRQDHCLLDLLWRVRSRELRADVRVVVSNHDRLRSQVEMLGVEYVHIPVTSDTKAEAEAQQLAVLKKHDVGLVVLAKYMQVLSSSFLSGFDRVINIHHSFLPAFAGPRPYHRAHERGVKIIGATAHYVTADLDEGPIIEQNVTRVSHRDTTADLIRKGRDLERTVLGTAVRHHLENRVLVYGNRTAVFA